MLMPYPKLGRYKGKGRPSAVSLPRGVPSLPPLPSLILPLARINPNGDPQWQASHTLKEHRT